MMSECEPIRAEELLAQADWVRHLARRLVADPFVADDVAQDAWLAVWKGRPRALSGDLRAWLAAVVRNLERKRRRDEAVRLRHERRAAVDEAVKADRGVHRLRLQRALADAVLRLREPYRGAVLERYLEGLTYASSAARHGVSDATARKRVSRALSLLRRELEGAVDFEGCLVPFAPFGPRSASELGSATFPLGGLVMGLKTTAVICALVAVVVTVGLLAGRGAGEPHSSPSRSAPALAPGGEARARPAKLEAREAHPMARSAAPPPPLAPDRPPDEGAVATADREHDLHGRVLDAGGRLVVGARIEVRNDRIREYTTLEADRRHPGRRGRVVARATSDDRGEFAIRVLPGKPFDLWVEAEGHSPAVFSDRYAGEYVEVTLRHAAEFTGTVRTPDGVPVAGAALGGWRDDASHLRVFEGRTDPNGEFSFKDLEPGRIRVRVGSEHFAQSNDAIAVLISDGETYRHDFVVRPGYTLIGTVSDAATGHSIEGAEVGQGWSFSKSTKTGATGEFVLAGFAREGHSEVHVRAPGYGRTIRRFDTSKGEVRLDAKLLRGTTVRGTIVNPTGEPLADAYVAAVATLPDAATNDRADWRSSYTGADGHFAIDEVRADVQHVLLVIREGYGSLIRPFPTEKSSLRTVEFGEVVLAAGGEIQGRVVDEEERGVPDCRLRLMPGGERHRAGPDRDDLNLWNDDDVIVGQRIARTDDLGRFRFADLFTGEYELQVSRYLSGTLTVTKEFDGALSTRVHVQAGEVTAGVRVAMILGETIAGRVTNDAGEPIAGIMLWVTPVFPSEDPKPNLVTGPDGAFEFRGLKRGEYHVDAYATNIGVEDDPPPYLSRSFGPFASGETELELELERGTLTSGSVRHADGTPAVKASVVAYDAHGEELDMAYTDVDGRFVLSIPSSSQVDLYVRPAPANGPFWNRGLWSALPVSAHASSISAGTEQIALVLNEKADEATDD